MPNVLRKDIDNVNAILTVIVTNDDYRAKFDSEIKSYRKKANLKGFRQGKAPMSFVKKTYGKSLMYDIISQIMTDELNNYLTKEKIPALGNPIVSDTQETFDIDIDSKQDYEFKFDLGLVPEFELKGIDETDEYNKYDVSVSEKLIDEELTRYQIQLSERTTITEGGVEENDIIKFHIKEKDGRKIKENGIQRDLTVLTTDIADEKLLNSVLSKSIGDKITIDIFKLEDKDEAFVRKYLLDLEEDNLVEVNNTFEAKIIELTRNTPAERNSNFFDKMFGSGEISTEDEAKKKLEEGLSADLDARADVLLFFEIKDYLLKNNNFDTPDGFLRRWMIQTYEEINDSNIEQEFDPFVNNLKWSIILAKLKEALSISISDEDIKAQAINRVKGYLGQNSSTEEMESFANYLMDDKEEKEKIYSDIQVDKILTAVKEKVKIKKVKIDSEKFNSEYQNFINKLQGK